MGVESGVARDHEPIDSLAEEFLERYRRGERPSMSEYITQHPDLASEIRELFPTLAVLERLGPRADEISGRPIDATIGGAIPRQLGEYRLLREVGRGGMGIVYEAEQLSLGRRVALKVLPSHFVLSTSLLTRFQNEARAAARLHHTNIVPVFGVGEDQGIHYYAMQFIHGQGLDVVLEDLRAFRGDAPRLSSAAKEVSLDQPSAQPLSQVIAANLLTGHIAAESASAARDSHEQSQLAESAAGSQPGPTKEHPAALDGPRDSLSQSGGSDLSNHSTSDGTYFRSVARMGIQVAEALAHAHSQGVLHRDIKPSNLLLDAYRTVWVTDFGLAKQEGSDLTHSGDVVGTLRYLAPERFRGASDARTDIYGLGVTLYELLTMRPAFTTTDRPRLIREIAHEDPLPPRRIEQRVPRDLETIVLKAMAKEPGRRYATADELAADLRRFLDDQPIAARRTGAIERMWRWCARRPALAGLSAALLFSLAVGLCGVVWQWGRAEMNLKEAVRQKGLAEGSLVVAQSETQRAEHNLQKADQQQSRAQHEAERAESNYKMARQAVDELLTVVSEDELINQPGLQPLRIRLLTRALEYYQGMLAKRADDPKAQSELAASYLRVAFIKRLTGPASEAKDSYRKVIALLESSIAGREEDAEVGLPLVRAYNELALMQISDSEAVEAQRGLERARQVVTRIVEAAPDSTPGQSALALTLNNVAYCLSQLPNPDLDEVIRVHQQALAIYRRMADEQPGDYNLERGISVTLSNMARRNIDARRFDEAQRLFDECLQMRLSLAQRKPDSLDMRSLLASNYNGLGDVLLRSPRIWDGRFERALIHYKKSLEIQEQLARENPAVTYYRQEAIGTQRNMSELYARYNDLGPALDTRHQANLAKESLLPQNSDNLLYHIDWASSLGVQADLEHRLELDADALASRYKAREAWRLIQEKQPNMQQRQRDGMIRNLAGLMLELGFQSRLADVPAIAAEQRDLCEGRPAALLALSWDLERAIRAARRGATLDGEATDAAERCIDLAIAAFSEGARGAPDQVDQFVRSHVGMRVYETVMAFDSSLGPNAENIGELIGRSTVLRQLGHLRRAEADWHHGVQLLEARLQKSPGNVVALRQRAMLHFAADRWPETVADSTRVLVSRPKDVPILRRRAIAAARLGHWQQAQEDHGRILAGIPNEAYIMHLRCCASFELGQAEVVASDMRRLREVVGQSAALASTATWLFLERQDTQRFPKDALWCAQRAIELDPRADLRIALGGAYCQLGRDQEAIDTLVPAADGAPGSAAALREFWLAVSWHRLGDGEKAQEAYQRALRRWKLAGAISVARDNLLQKTWQEAKSVLAGSESQPPRS